MFYDVDIFRNNISTLKEQSYDSASEEYMTESVTESINFDKVKGEYLRSINFRDDVMKSVDSLYEFERGIFFIEFKNGILNGKHSDIKMKIKDSLLLFMELTNLKLEYIRNNVEFILVYNYEKNKYNNSEVTDREILGSSRDNIRLHLMGKAGKEFVRFGYDAYKQLLFKDVHTYSIEEFKEFIS